jgi:hypothetical protein
LITSDEDWTGTLPSAANGGFLQYTSITISAGATLKIPSGLTFLSTGTVNINGIISVQPSAAGTNYQVSLGNAALQAGVCYVASCSQGAGLAYPPAVLASLLYPLPTGGGEGFYASIGQTGAQAGAGGGALVIRAAGAITVGSGGGINADGATALPETVSGSASGTTVQAPGSGGGGGGVLILASQTSFTNSNVISAQGGAGANAFYSPPPPPGYQYNYLLLPGGGGGGGGLVHILAPSISAGNIILSGGAAGAATTGNPTTVLSSSANISAAGYAGGAMGGSGGNGGYGTSTPAAAGSNGILFQSLLNPTALFTH